MNSSLTPFASKSSLENLYFQKIQEIDLSEKVDFIEYLSPQECNPFDIKKHLHMEREGIIVSTGTERSFFDLTLAPPLCQGLVVVDICHKVKAYVDFNTLLLKISNNRTEYVTLSADIDNTNEDFHQRIEQIRKKIIHKTHYLNKMDSYYNKNLVDFAKVYFGVEKTWRINEIAGFKLDLFNGVLYHQDDGLFQKLQHYAQAGNIISVVGDIQELNFLENMNVEVIDTSNICDYIPLNLKNKNFTLKHPTIIWTNIYLGPAAYYSKKYIPSDDETCKKVYTLLDTFKKAGSFGLHERVGDCLRYLCDFKRSDLVALTAETVPRLIKKLIIYDVLSLGHLFSISESDLRAQLFIKG